MQKSGTIAALGYLEITEMANAALLSNQKSVSGLLNEILGDYTADAKTYAIGDEVEAGEELIRLGIFKESKVRQALRLL